MIKDNTVLVLGAGASSDFGYPLGDQLKIQVASILNREKMHNLLTKGYGVRLGMSHLIDRFVVELTRDRARTIDRFLEKSDPEFQKLGKVAIAQVIMECEIEDNLFSQDRNWYGILFENLNISQQLHKISSNKLSIITFNYDRSLEHYLFESLVGEYGVSAKDEIAAQLRKIAIIHIHGKINTLPWEGGENSRPYGKDGFIPNLFDLADNLMLPKDPGMEIARAREVIQDAKVIYFLGFGYDTLNLTQLGIASLKQCPNLFGTCRNISAHKQSMIKELFPNNGFKFYSSSVDAYDFMMHHFIPNELITL